MQEFKESCEVVFKSHEQLKTAKTASGLLDLEAQPLMQTDPLRQLSTQALKTHQK